MVFFGMQFGGRIHHGQPFGRHPCPAVETVGEVTRHEKDGQPDDIDDIVRNDCEAELFFRRTQHLGRRCHVGRAADPAASQRAIALPGIFAEEGMDEHIGDDCADHDAGRSHEHDGDTLTHDPHDGRHVDLDEHQHDEGRQHVLAQTAINRRFARNDIEIVEKYRRSVNEDQRRQIMEQFCLGRFLQIEKESGNDA